MHATDCCRTFRRYSGLTTEHFWCVISFRDVVYPTLNAIVHVIAEPPKYVVVEKKTDRPGQYDDWQRCWSTKGN